MKRIPYWYLLAIPILFVGFGAALNQVVLIANHDSFPVMINAEQLENTCSPQEDVGASDFLNGDAQTVVNLNLCTEGGEFLDDTHVIMTSKTHLNFLADVFDLGGSICSVGDLGITAGSWMWDFAFPAWIVLIIRKFVE